MQRALHRTYKIKDLKIPTSVTQQKSFLSRCKVYRRFVLDFARAAAALVKSDKREPQTGVELASGEIKELDDLKQKLVSPIFDFPKRYGQMGQATVACDHKFAYVLMQAQ